MFFGQWRHLFGVIGDESRLNEVTFAFLTKYFIYQFTLAHRLIYRNTDRLCKGSQFVFCLSCDVKSCELFNSISHRKAWIRSFEIYCIFTKGCLSSAIHRHSAMLDQAFSEVHHPVIIFVSHINFHSRKLRVVSSIHTLVAEVLRKFIHSVKTSYNKTFQIEFVGNTHIERNIQRIVMGDKRSCTSSPWYSL